MSAATELDPSASVLTFYATEFRRERERIRMTQREMAKRAWMAPSLLNKIESAKRLPTEDLSKLADELFGTGDRFQRLWPLVIRYAYPAWFRPFVELEEAASIIRSFEVQVVPGLLQTERYARAVLAAGRLDLKDLDEQVSARLQRQRVFERADPPELRVVLDENVLRRTWGGRDVTRAQLERVIELAEQPRFVIQVIPYESGSHAGVGGPFAALTLDEGPDVVYVDGFLQGQIMAEPADVKAAHRTYDLLTAEALSTTRSIDLIASALKEL
ncbi:Scr1 family TA system antitoxin-like transcriptional regulator [Embleya sp. NPDC005575]|uniref:Scr1 family TA system antitoxin-like transcriptional regulator n=1 Tax=Embleya sp. NPDC005575 TaxID=3156892 RepID=UPI0033A2456F